MSTSTLPWKMVQKYPSYRYLNPDHPCFNNLHEVFNYKRDGNYNGLLSNVNFYNIGKEKKLDKSCIGSQINVQQSETVIPKVIVEDLKPNGITLQENDVQKNICKIEEEASVPKSQKRHRFTGDELLNLEDQEYNDLWEDFLPQQEISVLAGKGGIGKTMLYLQLSLLIVTKSSEFLNRQINSKHGSVLIIATEDNEHRLKRRIKKQLSKISGIDNKGLKNLIIVVSGEDLFKTIHTELSSKNFDLVVIDALGDVLDGDQNSQVDTRKFYNELQKFILEYETAFLLVTHEGKSQGKDARTKILGSVAVVDRARSAFMLRRDDKTGYKMLSIVKSNNVSEEKLGRPVYLEMDIDSLTFSVVEHSNMNISSKQIKVRNFASGADSRDKSKMEKPGRKINKAKWMKCCELLKSGKKQCEIATELAVSRGTVSRWSKTIRPIQPYDTSKIGDID